MSKELFDLRTIPLFAECAPDVLADWKKASHLKTWQAGEDLLHEGAPSDNVYTLISGVVRVFFEGKDRKRIVAKIFSGPAFFGEMELLTGVPHLEGVDVLQKAVALVTPRAVFVDALRRDHSLTARLLIDLSARFCVTAHLAKCTAFQTVENRLASMLLSYGDVWGVADGEALHISRPMTLNELADGLGVTRRSIERALIDFESRGWVSREGKHFSLRNVAELRHCSGELRLGVDYSLVKAQSLPGSGWQDLKNLE